MNQNQKKLYQNERDAFEITAPMEKNDEDENYPLNGQRNQKLGSSISVYDSPDKNCKICLFCYF
jgi:7-cyano-7-deazaguanine synthase in queuosine biosynthesis